MAERFKHKSKDIGTYFAKAPDRLKDAYKFNFTDGTNFKQTDAVMLVKGGVTDLNGSWFTVDYSAETPYMINGSPLPFVQLYGACIPNLTYPSRTITAGETSQCYWRWSENYIQCSSSSQFSGLSWEQQSLTGLMFIEMQAGGGGGGGSWDQYLVVGHTGAAGGGGGGGAYISMLVDLSKFSYIHISSIGNYGSAGAATKGGSAGGDTTITFYYKDGNSTTFTAYGGGGGGAGSRGGGGTAGSGGKTNPEVCANVAGITILRYFYGKGGGKGGIIQRSIGGSATNPEEGGSFIATDTRYFGEIIDSINISGGNDSTGAILGIGVAGGGGGAAALSGKSKGRGSRGGYVSYTENNIGTVTSVKTTGGTDGLPGVVYLYY